MPRKKLTPEQRESANAKRRARYEIQDRRPARDSKGPNRKQFILPNGQTIYEVREDEYTFEQTEFLRAIMEWKAEHAGRKPTYPEVLMIARILGYRLS